MLRGLTFGGRSKAIVATIGAAGSTSVPLALPNLTRHILVSNELKRNDSF